MPNYRMHSKLSQFVSYRCRWKGPNSLPCVAVLLYLGVDLFTYDHGLYNLKSSIKKVSHEMRVFLRRLLMSEKSHIVSLVETSHFKYLR